MELIDNLSKNMKRYRHQAHLNVEEFACQLSIGRSSLADIERKAANPTLKTVELISRQLNADPVALLSKPLAAADDASASLLSKNIALFSSLEPERRREALMLFSRLLEIFSERA